MHYCVGFFLFILFPPAYVFICEIASLLLNILVQQTKEHFQVNHTPGSNFWAQLCCAYAITCASVCPYVRKHWLNKSRWLDTHSSLYIYVVFGHLGIVGLTHSRLGHSYLPHGFYMAILNFSNSFTVKL